MQSSGFFDANQEGGSSYDRVYYVADFASYFASFVGNGVFAKQANQLQVKAKDNPGMFIDIQTGRAWINGYWYKVENEPLQLAVPVANGIYPRIDSIVVRWSKANRSCVAAIKSGSPSQSPTAPSVDRTDDVYEIQLATIRVEAGATQITQSAITDTRPNTSVCGWVAGLIDQIDATDLFAQFTAAFNEWFDHIKDQIPGDELVEMLPGEVEEIWNEVSE